MSEEKSPYAIADTQQPVFPQVSVNVAADGIVIAITLAPGLCLTQAFSEESMEQICQQWTASRLKNTASMEMKHENTHTQ